jgi:predicted nucleic acid-binding protein
MIDAPVSFLVDTNVLVYAYDRREPTKRTQAIFLLRRLGMDRSGALSAQILGEFFVTVTRKIVPPLMLPEVERSLTNYARSWPVLDVTAAAVLEATRAVGRHQLSYWDALIWATAKLNGVPNVLSEDFSDGVLVEGVRFLNPFAPHFDLSAWLPT